MLQKVLVPDLGSYSGVSIIEVLVSVGQKVTKEQSLITLETEKATMEIPSPFTGTIRSVEVKMGDKVSEGNVILSLETEEGAEESQAKNSETAGDVKKEAVGEKEPLAQKVSAEPRQATEGEQAKASIQEPQKAPSKPIDVPKMARPDQPVTAAPVSQGFVHAGPGVRRFARELGVNLSRVTGRGLRGRILLTDVQSFVKQELNRIETGQTGSFDFQISPWPKVEFEQFGEVEVKPLSRIKKLSGSYLHRNWIRVPHVTQFDEADITEMEVFRKENQKLAEDQRIKLTPLVFIMKAVTAALKAFPNFNASLSENGESLILKKYFHLGVAVDTPNGLVVPVVREVDQKGLFQLALELAELSSKARAGKLTPQDMQGSSFSISSLGGIGGTAFTPIVNVPDVAILGVSKATVKPIYKEENFHPRLMLPLSLSYDHRVIDGAEAARFSSFLVKQLSDIRRLLL